MPSWKPISVLSLNLLKFQKLIQTFFMFKPSMNLRIRYGKITENVFQLWFEILIFWKNFIILIFVDFLRTILAIYIPENQQFLQICNSIDWNWNECFDTKPLDLNQWHTIKLLQRKGIEVILYESYGIIHILWNIRNHGILTFQRKSRNSWRKYKL